MLSDKKIKKKLDEELKPTISADQFCEDAGITFEVRDEQTQKNGKKMFAKIFLPVGAAVAVSLSIALPITLGNSGSTSDLPRYGDNDVVYQIATTDSLNSDENVMKFNQSYVQNEGEFFLITPIGNSTKLGYKISNVIYAEVIDGSPSFAVTIDCVIRCYDGYTISNLSSYLSADKSYNLDDIKFSYNIVGSDTGATAFISFEHEKYGYFIQLNSFGQFTKIDEDSVQLFLRKAFTEEKTDDETVDRRQIYS